MKFLFLCIALLFASAASTQDFGLLNNQLDSIAKPQKFIGLSAGAAFYETNQSHNDSTYLEPWSTFFGGHFRKVNSKGVVNSLGLSLHDVRGFVFCDSVDGLHNFGGEATCYQAVEERLYYLSASFEHGRLIPVNERLSFLAQAHFRPGILLPFLSRMDDRHVVSGWFVNGGGSLGATYWLTRQLVVEGKMVGEFSYNEKNNNEFRDIFTIIGSQLSAYYRF